MDPTGSHNDGEFLSPCRGVANIATFHLHAAHVKETLYYVEGYNLETNAKIFRSELRRRTGCSFEYYSAPFVCNAETLGLAVHGMDEAGQHFKREELFFCRNRTVEVSTIAPTTKPPPTASSSSKTISTKNSTVSPRTLPSTGPSVKPSTKSTPKATTKTTTKSRQSTSLTLTPSTKPSGGTTPAPLALHFDVVFLVDVSQDAQHLLGDMIDFARSLMSAFEVSQDSARAAVISVGAMDSNVVATFNTISSQNLLDQYLEMLFQYDEFDEQGQDIVGALGVTVYDDFLNAGYRKDIDNHLIIYLTATTKFNEDPHAVAEKILTDGTYGIITVGYGPQATDKKALQRISGGEKCTFSANNKDSLNRHEPAIQALIREASLNERKYCGN
ncbi:von Willebrand factor type A domain protein [Ancylostoma caninum]|uniref:von Willebrand factor type A domain protein n=1 Tax=Ancylostoma caninum TaxID=29170 RepID=A0A368FWN7_ANCCA|nr:von Willebrand factor type A domain protein [Ancylostoma caninum]